MTVSPTQHEPALFARDRFTWVAYLLLGYFAYMQAVLGPLTPFLRAKLKLSYTVAGLHLSALAFGAVLSGLIAERTIRARGRRAVLWVGGAGLSLGCLMLAAAPSPLVTLSGLFLVGLCGSHVLVVSQAGLSDHHGRARAVALAESSLASSLAASFAPLMVGGSEWVGIGWPGALVSVAVGWAALALWAWRDPVPMKGTAERGVPERASGERLPGLFWAYWAILLLLIAAQWGLSLWNAAFLEKVVGLDKVTASTLSWVYLSALMTMRGLVMRLVRHFSEERILLGSMLLALVGFPLFWLGPSAAINVIGLGVTGLGVGGFYTMGLALAIGTAPHIADTASARVTVGVGLAMLLVPQSLGLVADWIGLRVAFGMVPAVMVLALGGLLLVMRRTNKGTVRRENGSLRRTRQEG